MFSLPHIPLVPAFGLGATELIIILVIILIIFGAGKLPKVMQSLGTGIRSFKKAAREDAEEPEEDEVEQAKITKKEVKNLSEGKKSENVEVEEEEARKKQEAEV